MAHVDIDALKAKFAHERLKRLRPVGDGQYVRVEGALSRYLRTPTRRPPSARRGPTA